MNGHYGPLVYASNKELVVGSEHHAKDDGDDERPFRVMRAATIDEFFESAAELHGSDLPDDYKTYIHGKFPYFTRCIQIDG